MVRTGTACIRIGSGRKSSKKFGAAPALASSNRSKSGSSSSTKLPPIPHQDTPAWQKPITNFFIKSNSPTKLKDNCSDNLGSADENTDINEKEVMLDEKSKVETEIFADK